MKITASRIRCAAALALLAAAASAIIGAPPPAHRDEKTGLAFPKTLAAFSYAGTHDYGEPGLGFSVRYKREGVATANIYIYTKDIADIPGGPTNAVVETESQNLRTELEIMRQRGVYRGLEQTGSGIKNASGRIAFRWGRYRFTTDGHAVISETFLTGYANRFIKVRLTYKTEDAIAGRAAAAAFIEALAAALEAGSAPGVFALAPRAVPAGCGARPFSLCSRATLISRFLSPRLALSAVRLLAAPAVFAQTVADTAAPKHKILLLDESRRQVLFIDQSQPQNDWSFPIKGEGGPTHAWSFQLIGDDRILCSMKELGGYREYELKTGKVVKEVLNARRYGNAGGAVRFPDGRTVLSADKRRAGQIFVFDKDGKETATWTFPELAGVRQIRRTARDTLLAGGSTRFVYEISLEGKILRQTQVPNANQIFQASELPNGNLMVSAGYGKFLAELTWDGEVVRHFGSYADFPAPEGLRIVFTSQFQILKNGNIVFATWTGHGANDSEKGQQVAEFSPDGKLVWKWHDPKRAGSIDGVYILDDLDTKNFYDDTSVSGK
jgi:hypothetical protein